MRVGVYNRWLATLGGGERYGMALAQELSLGHAVTVVSHAPVHLHQIRTRLDLDLSGVEFRTVPEQPAHALGPLSAEYDLFVNASNLDFVPARAAHNALVVYFPQPPPATLTARLRRGAGQWIRRWSGLPTWEDGIYGLETIQGNTVRGLAPRAAFWLPGSSLPYGVTLALANAHPVPCRVTATVGDLAHAAGGAWQLPPRSGENLHFVTCRLSIPATTQPCRVVLETTAADGPLTGEPVVCYMAPLQPNHRRYHLYRRLFEEHFGALALRLDHPFPRDLLGIVAGYDLVWAISRFSQAWVRTYWGLESHLLYPPVEVERFVPSEKRRQILSVGRYFAGSHNKKHDVMIRTFRRMVDAGLADWELHLAGGTMPGAPHAAYLARLCRMAEGYPIVLHTDLPADQLDRLYAESAIYWHAAGYGESEQRDPVKFEHFGITTVEAMAAGCVPVVIGKGGQRELVEPGHDGFLWYTTGELIRHTQGLIADPALRSRLAAAAQRTSRRFDRSHFRTQVYSTLAELDPGLA